MSLKRSIQDCHNLAIKRYGQCLSLSYKDNRTKLLWKCQLKHEWMATYSSIQQGQWCLICSGSKIKTLQDCHDVATKRNGKCLSLKYISNKTNMIWQCKYNHKWETSYNAISRGNWCPDCSQKRPKTLKDCQIMADTRDGKCLSLEYKSNKTKMLWECESRHQWYSAYIDIRQGHWCPFCSYLEAAKKSNNSGTTLHWKTNEKLIWKASYENKVINYLNENYINFWWQPVNFKTPILTKTDKFSTYRPDLYLPNQDIWIEIKGYFREKALEKWNWFHKEYPNSELWDKQKLENLGIL